MCARLFESLACILHFFSFSLSVHPLVFLPRAIQPCKDLFHSPLYFSQKTVSLKVHVLIYLVLLPAPLFLLLCSLLFSRSFGYSFLLFHRALSKSARLRHSYLFFNYFYSNATAEYLSRTLLQNIYVVALAFVMPGRRRGWCERVACALIGSLSP